MRNVRVIIGVCLLMVSAVAWAQEEVPARLETRVIQLKGAGLSQAYLQAIGDIVRQDYSPQASFQYDKRDRTLVLIATPITLEKVERFLNKVDVPREALTFVVWLLRTDGKRFDPKLDPTIVRELKEIDITGAQVVNKARLETISGRNVSFSISPESGAGYDIQFRPDGRRQNLMLSNFLVYKLVKSKDSTANKPVYDRWKVLQSSFSVRGKKPVIIGISGEGPESVVLAVQLLPGR